MSGYFQRPSLKPDTFEDYQPQPSSGKGLKTAFQNRNLNGLNDQYSRSSRDEGWSQIDDEDSSEYPRRSTGGLKTVFQERQNVTLDQTRIIEPGSSGLRGAFLIRQQSTQKVMDDSDSRSSVYSDYGPLYQHHEDDDYQAQPMGYHSVHRLSHLSKTPSGGNLKKAFEARTGGTIRKNLSKGHLMEKHANNIVSKMEKDDALMEDSPDAEELRRTTLRDMPQCLTVKRCVKVKLSKTVSQKSKHKPLSCWKMLKYRMSMGWMKFKFDVKDLAYSFELWYGPLRKIEGKFGTGVASFFKFLRWLFLVNFSIALISICFIVLPKAVNQSTPDSSASNIFADLITGEGYLSNTIMYYGSYTNDTIGSSPPYSMPHAYFFTMSCIYLVAFFVVGISAAKSYKRSFIETEGGLKNVFANKIFCGWDYNIATEDAAKLKSRAIYNELKELIWFYTKNREKTTFYQCFLIRSTQVFMHVLILCGIAGTAYAIWYFLLNIPADRNQKIIVAPIFVNSVMAFMPMLFSVIVRYEDYKNPKVALSMTLARTFLLGAACVGALVAFWLNGDTDKSSCWETSLAQEFYRMIVFDFVISVTCAALLDVFWFLIYKYFFKNTNLEFDIAWNTMQIIYNQTLFWVGLVFSPLLPVVVVIKLFLCWYIRMAIVLFLCKPSGKSWRAAQNTTWFLAMTFLSLLFVGGLIGYIISYIETSKDCGPFRNYDYIYEVVTLGVLKLKENSTVWTAVLFVTKPGCIFLILLALCARVYYMRAQANAQKKIVEQCRNMLVWSARDKEYYYRLISEATKGQFQCEFHEKQVNPELYDPTLDLEDNARGIIYRVFYDRWEVGRLQTGYRIVLLLFE